MSMQRIHKSKAFNMGGDVFVSVNAQYDEALLCFATFKMLARVSVTKLMLRRMNDKLKIRECAGMMCKKVC